jgi:hypothetical protein
MKSVGTVVGVSSTNEFQMQVKPDSVRVQDLVAVDTWEKADGGGEPKKFRVWAKVGSIERLNPLFPFEAAQELASQGRDPVDSVMSLTREMITARCQVVGVQRNGRLEPPKYPVQPAGRVYVPPAAEVESFLVGDTPDHRRLYLGRERGNGDVRVYVDGHAVVSRHLAVLASTGAGKTVATRKLLEELMIKGYPLLIFDPHGDYSGLHIAQKAKVTTYLPSIRIAEEEPDQVLSYISGMSTEIITEAQDPFLRGAVVIASHPAKHKTASDAFAGLGYRPLTQTVEVNHFFAVAEFCERVNEYKAVNERGRLPREILDLADGLDVMGVTANACARKCRRAGAQYARMIKSNRQFSEEASIAAPPVPLPRSDQLASIIQPGHVSIVSLEGYSDELRQSVVANVLSQLMDARIDKKCRRFLTVLEEAHNFIPNRIDGANAPSLPIIKRIATEGRKYGMGLVFISQRPSRIDATVLSQANSFLILRIVNPADQKYIRDVVETMGEDEAKALPNLNTGEALLSGQFTRIPVMVRVEKSRSEGKHEEDDFLEEYAAQPQPVLAAEAASPWGLGGAG